MSRVQHIARTPAFAPRLYSIAPGEADYPSLPGVWPLTAPIDGLFTPAGIAGIPIAAIGDRTLLSRFSIGLVCSVRCPGWVVLATFEFARKTPPGGAAIAGGFHSPMERTCLDTLLARHVPVIYCPARRLNVRGIPRAWETPLTERRLLILSPFVPAQRRVTRDLARERNRFVAAVSGLVFVPSASREEEPKPLCVPASGLAGKCAPWRGRITPMWWLWVPGVWRKLNCCCRRA